MNLIQCPSKKDREDYQGNNLRKFPETEEHESLVEGTRNEKIPMPSFSIWGIQRRTRSVQIHKSYTKE